MAVSTLTTVSDPSHGQKCIACAIKNQDITDLYLCDNQLWTIVSLYEASNKLNQGRQYAYTVLSTLTVLDNRSQKIWQSASSPTFLILPMDTNENITASEHHHLISLYMLQYTCHAGVFTSK